MSEIEEIAANLPKHVILNYLCAQGYPHTNLLAEDASSADVDSFLLKIHTADNEVYKKAAKKGLEHDSTKDLAKFIIKFAD